MQHVSTIPAHQPFLQTLLNHIISGYGDDQNALAQLWVLLPNRRSCLALRALFQAHGGAIPQLFALGDLDRSAMAAQSFSDAPPASRPISNSQRLMLASYELWQSRESIGMDMSIDQAARMAQEAFTFLDELEREQIPYSMLNVIEAERFASHWQQSLRGVHHLARWWSRYCNTHAVVSLSQHQHEWLNYVSDGWQAAPPSHGVMVAGSMGTQAATKRLLKVVASLPRGEVIIAGLDTMCDEQVWQQIEPTHPQCGAKRVLEALGAERSAVKVIGQGDLELRSEWLRHAMLPAACTNAWTDHTLATPDAPLFHLIEAANEWQEVQAIAQLVRDTDKKVAVITPDDVLLRRLSAMLASMNIVFNSTQSQPLLTSKNAAGLLVLADLLQQPNSGVALLAVLKEMECSPSVRAVLHWFETTQLRGLQRKSSFIKRLTLMAASGDWGDDQREWIEQVVEALEPWLNHATRKEILPLELWHAHIKCAAQLGLLHIDEATHDDMLHAWQMLPPIETTSYAVVLRQLFGQIKTVESSQRDARVQLLSPIEARLITADRVVLAGLNEGSWPQDARTDLWLNDAMRQKVGLPPRELAIGQSAHDFYMLSHASEIFYTRARRQAGAAALPSRWIKRLESCANDGVMQPMTAAPNAMPPRVFARPPAPSPPVEARPDRLSISHIDQFLRDPYAMYARHILKLIPQDPLDAPLDAKERGNVIHKVLEEFTTQVNGDVSQLNEAAFIAIAKRVLAQFDEYPQVALMWMPRLAQLATWIVSLEREHRANYPKVAAEVSHEQALGKWKVRGRIDRLGSSPQHHHMIVDYKAGSAPTKSDVESGFACQLPLAAWMVQQSHGGIADTLAYWGLGTGFEKPKQVIISKEVATLTDDYATGVEVLLDRYLGERTPFYAIPQPMKSPAYNDYEHLARVKEWLV